MPITKKEFEKGRKVYPAEKAVADFLRKHRGKAYSIREIAPEIGYPLGQSFLDDFLMISDIRGILNTLVFEGKASRRLIDFAFFYMATDKL